MRPSDVMTALAQIKEARSRWGAAQTDFTATVDVVMKRLLNEAAVNYISAEEVARLSGLTIKRVRVLMRENGLNPKNGKRLLAKTAAETLAENSALMGIEPRDFNLMSPLAYLPMGSQLRALLVSEVEPDEVLGEPTADDRVIDAYRNHTFGSPNGGPYICTGCKWTHGLPLIQAQSAHDLHRLRVAAGTVETYAFPDTAVAL